ALKLLVKTMINLNEKNLDDKTSLDIATTPEMKSILLSVGAKPSSEVTVDPTLACVLNRIVREQSIYARSIRGGVITEKERNTWLIVATLIATAMYASVLTPPGGVYQISVGDIHNLNITSSNSTRTFGFPGTSTMAPTDFYAFSILNMLSIVAAIVAIFILTPKRNGIVSWLVSLSI
ncbi:ankyrin repeat protein, partial [Trifolium medium]|nr:ankyrin repeat protein [Trifolium medium]